MTRARAWSAPLRCRRGLTLVALALLIRHTPTLAPTPAAAQDGAIAGEADVAIVVVAEGLSGWASRPSAAALFGALSGNEFFRDGRRAWGRMAAEAGMAPDEAFGAFLGTRVVVFIAGPDGAGRRPWAVGCQIADGVRADLLQALRAAPRKIVGRRPILEIEDGLYRLTTIDLEGASSVVLLAPTGHEDFLVELFYRGGLADTFAAPPSRSPSVRASLADGPGAMVRTELTARLIEDASVRVNLSAALEAGARGPAPADQGTLAVIGASSLFAMSERWVGGLRDGGAAPGALALRPALSQALNDSVKRRMGQSASVVVRASEGGGVRVAGVIETGRVSRVAPVVDAMIATWAQAPGDASSPDFGGVYPHSVRTLELPAGSIVSLLGESDVAWGFTERGRRGGRGERGVRGGWWIVGTRTELVEELSASLRAAPAARPEATPWVSVGFGRPRELLERVGMLGGQPAVEVEALVGLLRAIEHVLWQVTVEAPGAEAGGGEGPGVARMLGVLQARVHVEPKKSGGEAP